MNIYKNGQGIEWTHSPGTVAGATLNPLAGCFHNCSWMMPGGEMVSCYAEAMADRFKYRYPDGFQHQYWFPERLEKPAKKKEPHGIFLGSMADMFGQWVPGFQINAVLDMCKDTPQHTYFTLTKNPKRYWDFNLPLNVWAGCSLPGGILLQRENAATVMMAYLSYMYHVRATVRWLSLEPLWFDVAATLRRWVESGLSLPTDWMVIGAGSNGNKLYQPKPEWVQGLVDFGIEHNIPVFMKQNLDWPERFEQFPDVEVCDE